MVGSKYFQTAVLFSVYGLIAKSNSVNEHLEQISLYTLKCYHLYLYVSIFESQLRQLGLLTFKCAQCLQYLVLPTRVSSHTLP